MLVGGLLASGARCHRHCEPGLYATGNSAVHCGIDGKVSLGQFQCRHVIIGLQPRLLPMHNRSIGTTRLTITGQPFWVPHVQAVTVGGVPVEDWNVSSDSSSIVFEAPAARSKWQETYQQVSLNLNMSTTGGGDATYLRVACPSDDGITLKGNCESLDDRLYVTEACAHAGWFGTGANCQPCPDGATCPGGYRVRPEPGFWRQPDDEASLVVMRCQVPDFSPQRCLGGWASECGHVYDGKYCGSCAMHTYSLQNGCKLCIDDDYHSQRLLQGVVIITAYTCLCLSITFVPAERTLNKLVFKVVMLQQLVVTFGSVVKNNSLNWLAWLEIIYDVAKLV